jgi:GABA(A) receptor-associated protein
MSDQTKTSELNSSENKHEITSNNKTDNETQDQQNNPISEKKPVPQKYIEGSFTKNNSFLDRKLESERILQKYTNRIPVIVERAKQASPDIPYVKKYKFLVPSDLTVGQLMQVIRKHLETPIKSEKALFLFINNTIPPTSALMSEVYNEQKKIQGSKFEGFLIIVYNGENTFG